MGGGGAGRAESASVADQLADVLHHRDQIALYLHAPSTTPAALAMAVTDVGCRESPFCHSVSPLHESSCPSWIAIIRQEVRPVAFALAPAGSLTQVPLNPPLLYS